MTDEEILKAFQLCNTDTDCDTNGCPYNDMVEGCISMLNNDIISRFNELKAENADLRERLEKAVELPVKIGDKVYMPWVYGGESGIAECEVYHIALFKDRNDRILIVTDLKSDNIDFKRKYNYGQFMLRDFGVKLFTAPEAALARLAELKGKEE